MTGTGTQTDPYIIMDYTDLCNITGGSTKYYKLGADIDFSQTDRKSDADSIVVSFKELDGDGHTISNYFGRRSSATSYNSMFKYTATSYGTVKNLNFTGIYLSGGITCLFDMSGNANYVYLKNCRIATKINDTGQAGYAMFNKVSLTDCEVLIEGTSDYTKLITSLDSTGCLFRINLTFLNKNVTSLLSVFKGSISFCGITGKIFCSSESGTNYKLTDSVISNSYFAISFDNVNNFSMNDNFSGVNFYDKEVMANLLEKMPVSDNFYALTTAQCKNVEYLQGIDFPCISGDSV